MIFGRDMILNTPSIAYWEAIRLCKQIIIDNNNQLENKNRKTHAYIIQDKVLVCNKKSNKYEEPYVGPDLIAQLLNNGNVTVNTPNR